MLLTLDLERIKGNLLKTDGDPAAARRLPHMTYATANTVAAAMAPTTGAATQALVVVMETSGCAVDDAATSPADSVTATVTISVVAIVWRAPPLAVETMDVTISDVTLVGKMVEKLPPLVVSGSGSIDCTGADVTATIR